MAERYDWDRDRDRDREMDRERGSENRDRENRWNQGRNQDWDRQRENWRGGSPGEFNQQWQGGNRSREDAGRYSETGEQGDWGRQANWGSFGNRPDYHREAAWNSGRQHNYRNESERGGYSGGRNDQGGGSPYQGRDRDFGGPSERYPAGPGFSQGQGGYSQGGSNSYGSYQGGMGSFGGGMGGYGEKGRFSGRGPKGWQRSDERIREDVNERLTDHPHIDASEIEVAVKNGEITLTGTVEDRNTKRQVEEVAEQVSGVKEVHNQIRVQPNHQQPAMQGQGSSSSTGSSASNKK